MKCLIFLACLFGISYAGPLHASCKADWTFNVACDQVKQRLVSQINAWSTADNCPNGAGERCLYHVKHGVTPIGFSYMGRREIIASYKYTLFDKLTVIPPSTADYPNGADERWLYYTLSTTYIIKSYIDQQFQYGSETATTLTLVHETPVHHYKDDVKFTFADGSTAASCNVHGYSSSQTWYAILDYGTNYCNMRNLIEGANLHTEAGFTETTSDKICTQYSSANCDKY